MLSNPRHEAFAVNLAQGMSITDAHQKAGYKPNRRSAHQIWTNSDIRARVHELQTRNLQKQDEFAQISASRLAEQLARAYEIAEKAKRPADMVAATIAQAKFTGQWVERSEVAQPNEFQGMTLEQMRAELVVRARRLGLDRELAGLLEGPKDRDDEDDRLNGNGGEA